MSEAVEGTQVWVAEPRLAGIYVLQVDGRPVASTSLVDESLSRSDKIEALARVDWVPPQHLAADYKRIVEARQIRWSQRTLPGDRRTSPCSGGFGATIDGDEDPSEHPVRRYLFPDLERTGSVALDPGETIITSWKSFTPELKARLASDGRVVGAGTDVPSGELRGYTCVLTNQRLVYHGSLHVPLQVREDYPSIFLPSALFETIATYRQVKRWATRPNLDWGCHVRHEWVSELGCGNVPERKKPRLSRYDDTMFIHVGFRYPSGDTATFRLPYKQAAPSLREIAEAYVGAVRAQPAITTHEPHDETRQTASGSLFSSRKETEAMTTWRVDGTVPWSLPPALT